MSLVVVEYSPALFARYSFLLTINHKRLHQVTGSVVGGFAISGFVCQLFFLSHVINCVVGYCE